MGDGNGRGVMLMAATVLTATSAAKQLWQACVNCKNDHMRQILGIGPKIDNIVQRPVMGNRQNIIQFFAVILNRCNERKGWSEAIGLTLVAMVLWSF